MKTLLEQVTIDVSARIYLKDPNSSELGKNIVREGILLIDEIGIEAFTFKKLAHRMCTTESTIYRYFENKHKFLLYLISWFWGWLEYELVMGTGNLDDPKERLLRVIEILCQPVANDLQHQLLNLQLLYNIVIEEAPKTIYTREVEIDNENGLFSSYKRVVNRLAEAITETNPNYPFQLTLSTTILETINQQKFLATHFPKMTNLKKTGYELDKYIKGILIKLLDL